MDCPWCNDKEVEHHLTILEDDKGHIHVHAPFENKNIMRRLIVFLLKEANNHGMNVILSEKEI